MIAKPSDDQIIFRPEFIQASQGRLFSLFHFPRVTKTKQHAVVFFPPFAEEMNKSRRMIALQARAFAGLGLPVIVVDLFGTGDSEGDFSQATVDIWRNDFDTIIRYVQEQGYTHLTLWGLRFGALLLMDLLRDRPDIAGVENIIFWQPVLQGEMMMTQFLRLRLAADMMSSAEKVTTKDMRQLLAEGNELEVAGYTLSPDLVFAIDGLSMKTWQPEKNYNMFWFDVVSNSNRPAPVVNQQVQDTLTLAGMHVNADKVVGDPFWSTAEISTIPELIDKTSAVFTSLQR